MSRLEDYYDVAIVGAGPCGVTAANLLGKYGVKTLLLDKDADILDIPRAIGICEEGSRIMQAAGLIDNVKSGFRAIRKVFFVDKQQKPVFHMDIKANRNGFSELSTFFQPDLERSAREGLTRFDNVHVHLATELREFTDHGGRVELKICKDTQEYTVECQYLLGCDGAKSPIRKRLGIGFSGDTYPQDWMILDIEKNPLPNHEVVFSIDPNRPSVSMPGPDDKRRWEFVIKPGEKHSEFSCRDKLRELLKNWGDVDKMSIQRQAIYTFHARTASNYRNGNVFLLGDAAHITPPFAGQGMMAGLRDAYNLCWKLDAVIKGRTSEKLLHSYEQERIPQSKQIIKVAQLMGTIILPQKQLVARCRNMLINLLAMLGIHSKHKGMPIQKIPNHINGSVWRHAWRTLTRHTGSEFPQYPVANVAGQEALFDSLSGDKFYLLSWFDNAQAQLDEATLKRWKRLSGGSVCFNANHEHLDNCLCLKDGAKHYRRYFQNGKRVVVIRPDKMVVVNCKPSQLNDQLNRYMDSLGVAA